MITKVGGLPRDYAVIIDETFFTKKKVSKGGFQGRITGGHKVILMAGVEINLHTQAETGRKFWSSFQTAPKKKSKQLFE
eukprot:3056565-Karenia_brevis.AAC.1